MSGRVRPTVSMQEMGRRLGERAHLERAGAIFAEIGAEWDLARAREALADLPVVQTHG